MKRLIVTLIFAGALVGMALQAQDPPSGPPPEGAGGGHRQFDPDREIKHLTKELKLTADQQTQIKAILQDRHQQMQAIRDDSSLEQKDRMTKMRALREDRNTKIEAVLNADQKTKYEAMQQAARERMKQRREQHEQNSGPEPNN